ncbi:MAG: hypothetical protein KKC28_09870, partial [Verrucomicrobia bacterium]|nr:hypothetical protein [Verrucomicrobiota bacterium]
VIRDIRGKIFSAMMSEQLLKMKIANKCWVLSTRGRGWPRLASAAVGMLLWALAAAGAETTMEKVRVFTTESACFEYLFTGVMNGADGQTLLAFNQRNGRTIFAKRGESLGSYRITAFESKTNRVYNASVNAYLDEPSGRVTLAGPGNVAVILEQDRRLPWPGRVAWLVRLDNGTWWNIQEQDVFFMDNQPVAVEEIDEDGVTVTAGQDLQFIRLISSAEKKELNRLWADRKRQEQNDRELELQRQREAARPKATGTDSDASYFTYARRPHVEIRGPARFFYGNEYRFPTAFKVSPAVFANGQIVQQSVVIPTGFETRSCGISLTVP